MYKFLFVILVSSLLITCSDVAEEADFNSQRAILDPKPIDFDSNVINSKLAEWQEKGINYYSFIEKHTNTNYPPDNYISKITIIDNTIYSIEMLDEEYIRSGYYNKTEGEYERLIAIHKDQAEVMIGKFGDISGIYERLLAWHQETSATLGKYEKMNCEINYNEQYPFPEYLEFGVYAYQYIGNNTWSSRDGGGSRIIEISDFTVYEEPPFDNIVEVDNLPEKYNLSIGVHIWNDYMPGGISYSDRPSICTVQFDSPFKLPAIKVSATIITERITIPVLLYDTGNDMYGELFRKYFRPVYSFRLNDQEEYTIEIIVKINGEQQTITIENQKVFTTS